MRITFKNYATPQEHEETCGIQNEVGTGIPENKAFTEDCTHG